jgi:hypothetical protein
VQFIPKYEAPKPTLVEKQSEVKKSEGKKSHKGGKKKSKKSDQEKMLIDMVAEMDEPPTEGANKDPRNKSVGSTVAAVTEKSKDKSKEKQRKLLRPLGREPAQAVAFSDSNKLAEGAAKLTPPSNQEAAPVKARTIEKKKKAVTAQSSSLSKPAKNLTADEPNKDSQHVDLIGVVGDSTNVSDSKRSIRFKEDSLAKIELLPQDNSQPVSLRLEKPVKSAVHVPLSHEISEKPKKINVDESIKQLSSQPKETQSTVPSTIGKTNTTMSEQTGPQVQNVKENELVKNLSDASTVDQFDVSIKKRPSNTLDNQFDHEEANHLQQKALLQFLYGMHGAPIRIKSAQYRLPFFSFNNDSGEKPPSTAQTTGVSRFEKKTLLVPSLESFVPPTSSDHFTKWLVHYNLKQTAQEEREERVRVNSANITHRNLNKWYDSIEKKLAKRPVSSAFASRRELDIFYTPESSSATVNDDQQQQQLRRSESIMTKPTISRASGSHKEQVDFVEWNKSTASVPLNRRPATSVSIMSRPPPSTPNSMSKKDETSDLMAQDAKPRELVVRIQPVYTVSQIEMEEIMNEVNARVETRRSVRLRKTGRLSPSKSRQEHALHNRIYERSVQSSHDHNVVLLDEEDPNDMQKSTRAAGLEEKDKAVKIMPDTDEIFKNHRYRRSNFYFYTVVDI